MDKSAAKLWYSVRVRPGEESNYKKAVEVLLAREPALADFIGKVSVPHTEQQPTVKGTVDQLVINVANADKKATVENKIAEFLTEIIKRTGLGSAINEILTPTTTPRRSAPGIVLIPLAITDAEQASDLLEIVKQSIGETTLGKYVSSVEAPGLQAPGKARRQKSAPGYVFVQADMNDEVQKALADPLMGFIGWADGKRQVRDPMPIPSDQLHAFFEQAPDIDDPLESAPVAKQEGVKIKNGMFAGYTGVVEQYWPTRERAWVRIQMDQEVGSSGHMPLTQNNQPNQDKRDPARRERTHIPKGDGKSLLIDVAIADIDKGTDNRPRLHDANEFPADDKEELVP